MDIRHFMWNYLRIRGEESRIFPTLYMRRELPPHTRRRAGVPATINPERGTTSAYAEKSDEPGCHWRYARNYLRIRGEEFIHAFGKENTMELPPHTRRRVLPSDGEKAAAGTTSAYAEKSRLITPIIP